MKADEIKNLILETFPDAKIKIDDLRGDGDHYAAYIETNSFKGLSKVKQHQMVYKALKGKMAKEINERALLEVAKQNNKKALGQAVKKGALYEGQINAVIAGGQDAMLQTTAIESGVQDEFSFKQAGLSSFAGFGLALYLVVHLVMVVLN